MKLQKLFPVLYILTGSNIYYPLRPSFRPSLLQARWSDRNLPTFTPRSDPNEGRVRWESGGAHCPHDERKEWDDNEPHQSFSPFNLLCGRWVRSWFVPHPISLCKEGANPPPSRSLSSSSVLTSWTERSGSEWWGDGGWAYGLSLFSSYLWERDRTMRDKEVKDNKDFIFSYHYSRSNPYYLSPLLVGCCEGIWMASDSRSLRSLFISVRRSRAGGKEFSYYIYSYLYLWEFFSPFLFLGLGSFLAGVTVVRRRLAPPVPTVPFSYLGLTARLTRGSSLTTNNKNNNNRNDMDFIIYFLHSIF